MLSACFAKGEAQKGVPPAAADWRAQLPRPVFDEKPELVDFYYKAWEIAHTRIDTIPGLPAPRYMDEAHRSDRIWIWDTCFMVHFCKYCPEEFPGIESLENFYGVMLADKDEPLPKVKGNRWCGENAGKMLDFRIHHPDNPPLFAWTEYAYALQTGDRARLEKVYCEKRWLQRWYELFENFDPMAPQPFGSVVKVAAKRTPDGFRWKGCPSGMDNTPRGRAGAKDAGHPGKCPDNPDLLWVDALAQQGLSALYLSRIADLLGRTDEAQDWMAKYEAIKAKVNEFYWDETDGFYYDILASDRSKVKVMTPASFWAALAEMPTAKRACRMLRKLEDASLLGGVVPTPSLARNDRDFIAAGGYWRGSVWMPTTYMTVKSAEIYGEKALARDIARKVVDHMYRTYVDFEPHTIWECYSPTETKPAITAKTGKFVRSDFCGWSALGPVSLFLENVIGVRAANAFARTFECDFERNPKGRVGVENYRFGDVVCSVVATADEIKVKSNKPFVLLADGRKLAVRAGEQSFARNCPAGARVTPDRYETAKWQREIDEVAAHGGGRVVIPSGVHPIGGLELRSGVDLHLEKGAVLEGAVGLEHYRKVVLPNSEGDWTAVVMGVGVTNVAITGEGTITGRGQEWPQPRDYGGNEEEFRARGIFFANSKCIRLEGFALRDAACWGIVLKCCDGVQASRVTIDNHANANNDGFDIEAKNVLIENCDVDTGDDAYCLKSNDAGFTVENVTVRDCTARSHCNALKLGTASHGVMQHVRFERCRIFAPRRDLVDLRPHSRNYGKIWYYRGAGWTSPSGYDADYPNGIGGCAIAVEDVDGGRVRDVSFRDIEISGCRVPIFVRAGTRMNRGNGILPNTLYDFGDLSFENIRGSAESVIASSITGVEGCPVKNVRLKDVSIVCRGAGAEMSAAALNTPVPDVSGEYPECTMFRHILPAYGLWVDRVDGIVLDNVGFTLRPGDEDVRPAVSGVN